MRQQFTLKERDIETGLDYFLARYYSSTQGRFTSIDPLMASGRTALPQSWNRYSYVLNNPLRLVDPTGLQDDHPQTFTIKNPCEYGTAGCNPVQLGTVTVTDSPPPISTTPVIFSTTITLASPFALSGVAGAGVGSGPVGGMLGAYVLATPSGMMADEQQAAMIAGLAGLDTSMHDRAQEAWIHNTLSFSIWLGITDAPAGSWDADGNLNDPTVIVRGGIAPDFTPGASISGAYGGTLFDAASGVPHNQIWHTTAAEIRKGGGSVIRTPEPAYPGGPINYRHATIVLGNNNSFVGPIPNPVPKADRVPGRP